MTLYTRLCIRYTVLHAIKIRLPIYGGSKATPALFPEYLGQKTGLPTVASFLQPAANMVRYFSRSRTEYAGKLDACNYFSDSRGVGLTCDVDKP